MARPARPRRLDYRKEFMIWCAKHRSWEDAVEFSRCEYAVENGKNDCTWSSDPAVSGKIANPREA
jgi:hypothetical protein